MIISMLAIMEALEPGKSETETKSWQVGTSLQECFGMLLEKEAMSDVTLTVTSPDESSQEFKAHTLVLSARSPVFEAMFSGKYQESSGTVRIEDSESEPFYQILRYMYTDEVELTCMTLAQIMNLSRIYMLDGLMEKCRDFLEYDFESYICTAEVCNVLLRSVYYLVDEVSEKCLELFWSRRSVVLQMPSFLQLSGAALRYILRSDATKYGFTGESDKNILEGVLKWADAHCKANETKDQKEYLGELVYDIRYSTLTPSEFVQMLDDSNIMTDDQKYNWLRFIGKKDANIRLDPRFNLASRGPYVIRRITLEGEDCITNPGRQYSGYIDKHYHEELLLTSDRRARLVELVVCGPGDKTARLGITIGTHGDIANLYVQRGYAKGGKRLLNPDLELQPGVAYRFTAALECDDISPKLDESYFTQQHKFGGALIYINQEKWFKDERHTNLFASFSFDFD